MCICLCLSAGSVRAQSVSQLIEQLTLDIQKLSQLKTILKDMQEGYQVLDKGYINIRDIVKGNFNLHKTFLDGLLSVSLPVSQYYKVAATLDMEKSIVDESGAGSRRWAGTGIFTADEWKYVQDVCVTSSGRAAASLDRLSMVISPGMLWMSDAERMDAIDGIYVDVQRQLAALRAFNDAISIQALQRARELNNIQKLKSIYGNYP